MYSLKSLSILNTAVTFISNISVFDYDYKCYHKNTTTIHIGFLFTWFSFILSCFLFELVCSVQYLLHLLPSHLGFRFILRHTWWNLSYIHSAGTKFFVVCEPGTLHMEALLKVIYELYTDYVLKNPFYEMEMPIRCELFDLNLTQVIQKDRVSLLGR